MTRKIFFTGGGSAGHVTPSLALIERLQEQGWQVYFVGSKNGIERSLTSHLGIPYFSIASGKLRRYFDWQNFVDPFFILCGVLQSIYLCLRHRPNIVFSKGGFVAVPLVVGAWICRIPVIAHESDITPGLANKLCFPFARYICVNFPQTVQYLPGAQQASENSLTTSNNTRGKIRVTGSPVRKSLINGNAERGRTFLGFDSDKTVLLVFGGSLGARAINECVWRSLPKLLEKFQVVHIVGKGNINSELNIDQIESAYQQKEYIHSEFGDVLAASDLVISRAGANSIYELLIARKPHILVPLTRLASRGDQIVNASIFEKAGISRVIQESDLSAEHLMHNLAMLIEEKGEHLDKLAEFELKDAVTEICELITETSQ